MESILFFCEIVCIAGIMIIFFAYAGFPFCLIFLSKVSVKSNQRRDKVNNDELPDIQVIISCYNEAEVIARRIANIFEQEYPGDKLSVLVISDGSSDGSDEIVKRISKDNDRVELFATGANLGKNEAINLASKSMAFKCSLLCFTDADAEFDQGALASAARFFSSPRTGLVGGNITYWLGSGSANRAEGAFWRLENVIREAEGNLGWLVSCPGQFILMRRELFQPLPAEANTDFAMPLMVLAQGYAARFDAGAMVRSLFPTGQKEILRRRRRTVIRALTTISHYRKQLPRRLRQVLFWHKTIRFNLFPVQIAVFISNFLIVAICLTPFWQKMLGLQLLFYGLTMIGWLAAQRQWKVPLVSLPYQFSLQNAVVFGAVIRYLKGQRVAKWTPPR